MRLHYGNHLWLFSLFVIVDLLTGGVSLIFLIVLGTLSLLFGCLTSLDTKAFGYYNDLLVKPCSKPGESPALTQYLKHLEASSCGQTQN